MSVKTSIKVNDEFTQPLQSMANALNMTISHFEKLQEVSEEPVQTDGLRFARDQLANMDNSLSQMRNGITLATNEQHKYTEAVKLSDLSVKDLVTSVFKLGTVIKLVKTGVNKLKDGFGIYRDFTGAIGELAGITQATAYEMEALSHRAKVMGETTRYTATQSAQGMIELSKGGFSVYETIISINDALNLATGGSLELSRASTILVDTLRGFNMEASESQRVVDVITYAANNATTDIGQMGEAFMQSAGVARQFNASIEETAVLIAGMSNVMKGSRAGRALRSGLGRLASPTDAAQGWFDALQINVLDPTTRELRNIIDIVGDLGDAFNELGTNQQKIAAAKDIFGEQMYAGWLELLEMGSEGLNEMLDDLVNNSADAAEKLAEMMMSTTDGMMTMFDSKMESIWINFYDSLADGPAAEAFEYLLEGFLIVFQVILTIAEILIVVLGTVFKVIIEHLDVVLPMLVALAGIFLIVTSVTWLWVGVILLVVGAFALVINITNRVVGTQLSAIGIIVGAIAVALAFVANLVIALINFLWGIGVALTNALIGFAEFLANLFISPVQAIGSLFQSLGGFIFDILSSVAGALDSIFGSNLSGAVNKWRGSLKGKVDALVDSKGVEFDRVEGGNIIDRIDLGDAWSSGYSLGENIGGFFSYETPDFDYSGLLDSGSIPGLDGLDGLDNQLGGIGDGIGDIGDKLGGIGDKAGKTANNTGKMKDSMKATEEDIKHLMDLANTSIINRYTSTQVKVEMNNENKIDSELDIDGVINRFADGLEDVENLVPEGV